MGVLSRFSQSEVFLKIFALISLTGTLGFIAAYEHPTSPPLYLAHQEMNIARMAKVATLAPGMGNIDGMPGRKPPLENIKKWQLVELALYGVTSIGGLIALGAMLIVICRYEERHYFSILMLPIYGVLAFASTVMAFAFIIVYRNDRLIDWHVQVAYVVLYAFSAICMLMDWFFEAYYRV